MPEQPNEHENQQEEVPPTNLRILQINLNKSEKAHLDIINDKVSSRYDIMLIQEPHATAFRGIRTPANFRPVYPKNRFTDDASVRSVIWVNTRLETKNWKILDIPHTNDITAIQIKGTYGKISIFNVYNECTHSRNENIFRDYLAAQRELVIDGNDTHMIWAGDFNRHHPLWDDDKDTHLFTTQALRNAEGIINLLAEHDMEMSLPKGIPTLQHMRSKKYSRPDNVFCSTTLQPFVIKCEVMAKYRPTCTDHFPIETYFDLPQTRIPQDPSYNFRTADWKEFRKKLEDKLNTLPGPEKIRDLQHLTEQTPPRRKTLVEWRPQRDEKRAQSTKIRFLQKPYHR
jgi:endonuclease/exonuclease/phosphatase family metal-dependent hydrolase